MSKQIEPTYTYSDLAALLVALLRNTKEDGTSYRSFQEQIDGSMSLGASNSQLGNALAVIQRFHRARPDLFEAAHVAIRDLLVGLSQTEKWGVCAFVSPNQIRRIADL